MSRICQEKFELTLPAVSDDSGNAWVSDKSARTQKGLTGGEKRFYNELPPGSDLEAQSVSDQPSMALSMSGETDVSRDWNPEAVRDGFTRRRMRPTDDMYTNEHCDAFYDEITVDGVTGFLERNNLLDRQ